MLVGYSRHMRLHITVDDELVAELDRRAGSRRRSAFIAELIRHGLDDERRWDDIEAALGAIPDQGHEWDDDPGEWVRRQRSDRRRVG
jgi:Arc/MetJ family transcription regulator